MEASDGVTVMENDALVETCTKLLGEKRPSFDTMNDVAAKQLAHVLMPANIVKKPSTCDAVGKPLTMFSDPIVHLCSHPGFKLLTLKCIPQIPSKSLEFSSHNWSGLLRHLTQMTITNVGIYDGT